MFFFVELITYIALKIQLCTDSLILALIRFWKRTMSQTQLSTNWALLLMSKCKISFCEVLNKLH